MSKNIAYVFHSTHMHARIYKGVAGKGRHIGCGKSGTWAIRGYWFHTLEAAQKFIEQMTPQQRWWEMSREDQDKYAIECGMEDIK